MLAETGQICLILAMVLSGLQAMVGFVGASRRDLRLMVAAERSTIAQSLFCITAFGCLATTFVISDFSVALVEAHSHTLKPTIYKFSGTWGNHEGSMLLWVMLLAVFGAAMVVFGQALPATLRVRAIATQGLVGLGFSAFLLFTSNPFKRLSPVPIDGQGLNPLLQDPGLAIHPPFLYLGYVGFSVAFSFAVAALIEGRLDAMWARWVRPWVLLAWSFLTIGITIGSIWAYYELGWGGWWAWDPVENVSFMPWLAGTALLHSTIVVQARSSFIRWTVLLAIVTFSLSLIGTFIVRSGVLTSVHAFAVDPGRGVFLLGLLALATGGALYLYYLRSDEIETGASFEPISREGGLVLNNLLLSCAIATIFLGTFYPIIMDALSYKMNVGPPYYNWTFAPIMSGLIIFMAVGPLLKWGEDTLKRHRYLLMTMAASSVVMSILVWIYGRSVLGAIGYGLATWLAVGTLISYGKKLRIGHRASNLSNFVLRARALPLMTHGFALSHLGIAVATIGVTAMSTWAVVAKDRLKVGEALYAGAYTFELVGAQNIRGPNYLATEVELSVTGPSAQTPVKLFVEGRYYPVEKEMTSEGSMDISPLRNLYAALGEGDIERGWVINAYVHPMVSWIWFGAFMMAFGGLISLADRKIGFVKMSHAPITPKQVAAE